MNKFQSLATLVIEEVRAAELASLDQADPEEAELLIRERVENFLRENLIAIFESQPEEEKPASAPDDFLSVPDPSTKLELSKRWNWKPGV